MQGMPPPPKSRGKSRLGRSFLQPLGECFPYPFGTIPKAQALVSRRLCANFRLTLCIFAALCPRLSFQKVCEGDLIARKPAL